MKHALDGMTCVFMRLGNATMVCFAISSHLFPESDKFQYVGYR
jgi:hypothetical protein